MTDDEEFIIFQCVIKKMDRMSFWKEVSIIMEYFMLFTTTKTDADNDEEDDYNYPYIDKKRCFYWMPRSENVISMFSQLRLKNVYSNHHGYRN